MNIGSIGDVVFSVDSNNASILKDYQRTVSANYTEHSLIGQTAALEYTGTNPMEISFVVKLSAFFGVNPQLQLERLEAMAKQGREVALTIGSSIVGEGWAIQSVSAKAEYYDRDGDVTSYEVSVSLKECVTPKVDADTSGFYLEESNTGWQKSNGNWYYYLNGVMQTGWTYEGGSWYYLGSNGVMQTGWIQYQGIWYYLKPYGNMATGWVQDGGAWYYLNESGAMQTGWIEYEDDWYYCYSNGVMAQNVTIVISGVSYTFDASGKCTNPNG